MSDPGRSTPLFSGADEGKTHRHAARKAAHRLLNAHPELGYSLLYSAAAYVIRDGRAPKDEPVLEEARRRKRWMEVSVARNERRFAKDEAA